MYVVLVVFIIILIIRYNSNSNKSTRNYMDKILNIKCDYECNLNYKGGIPEFSDCGVYRFKIFKDKIRLCKNFENCYKDIYITDILTFDEIITTMAYNKPKLGNVATLGVVGMCVGNEKISEDYKIKIQAKDLNSDHIFSFIIQTNTEKDFSDLYSKLNNIL